MVGLGLLGSALAERFLASGMGVVGFDLDPERRERLREIGGRPADALADVAADRGRIVLSLPDSDAVEAVVAELEPMLAEGSMILDTTTGAPDRSAALGAHLAEQGIEYLDATVAGSSEQARAGEVLVMAGGSAEAYRAGSDLLRCFAPKAFHLGPWGAGARMKLVVNLVLGLNRAVLAEGLAFARSSGIDPAQALDVLAAGPAHSLVMDLKGRKMVAEDFTPQARVAQHHKDVRLILASGARTGAKLPLSELHAGLLEQLIEQGYGAADNSAIIKAFEPSKSP